VKGQANSVIEFSLFKKSKCTFIFRGYGVKFTWVCWFLGGRAQMGWLHLQPGSPATARDHPHCHQGNC